MSSPVTQGQKCEVITNSETRNLEFTNTNWHKLSKTMKLKILDNQSIYQYKKHNYCSSTRKDHRLKKLQVFFSLLILLNMLHWNSTYDMLEEKMTKWIGLVLCDIKDEPTWKWWWVQEGPLLKKRSILW